MRLALLAAALLSTAPCRRPDDGPRPMCGPADRWHAKAREIYERAISIPTVQGRGQVPELAQYLEQEFRAGGLTGVTIHPYDVSGRTTIPPR